MNAYFTPYAYPEPPDAIKLFPGAFKQFGKIGDLTDPSPSGTWVVIDERDESINNGHLINCMDGIYPRNPSQFGLCNLPANYHNGAGGLTFADGHSEIHKWRDPRTTPPKGQAGGSGYVAPVPSPTNQDVYWLGVRTTGLK